MSTCSAILRFGAVSLACASATMLVAAIAAPTGSVLTIAPAANASEQVVSVAEFLARHPASGRFTLEGYVVELYACPPCPARSECKPCEGDHIVVADEPPRASASRQASTATIFVEQQDLQALPVGGRFRLETEISPAGVRLISAQKIR